MTCPLCHRTSTATLVIGGSKRTGAPNVVVCSACWVKYVRYEIDLPSQGDLREPVFQVSSSADMEIGNG